MTIASSTQLICFVALSAAVAIGALGVVLLPNIVYSAFLLGGVFLYYAVRLLNPPDELFAMEVFKYSIWYLMALFAFLLIDHWLMPSAVALT